MSNAGPTASSNEPREQTMAAYDRLPAPLRAIIADAPYDYAMRRRLADLNRYVKQHGRRAAIELCTCEWRSEFKEAITSDALTLYGRDHPQALQPPPRRPRKRR